MKQISLPVLILLCMLMSGGAAYANGDIYVCTDANGVKTYGNVGNGRGCKKVELPSLTTFPATKRAAKVAGTPGDFPKVDDSVQKKRDTERQQILEDELKVEQKKLADLNKQYNAGEPERTGGERNYAKYQERTEGLKEDLSRTQHNIESLQREITGLN